MSKKELEERVAELEAQLAGKAPAAPKVYSLGGNSSLVVVPGGVCYVPLSSGTVEAGLVG